MLAGRFLGEVGLRTDPVLGESEEVGAPPLPGAGRRHAHEVDPDPDARDPQACVEDLLLAPRPACEEAA
jgi:hypothetical protein